MMAFRDWPTRCLDGRKPLLPCVKRNGLLSFRCAKHSLPPRPHGWTFAEASYERLSATSRAAAVKAPKRIWTHEMLQAKAAAEAAHEAHTSPHQETAYFEQNSSKKEKQNEALRRCSAVLLEARVEKLGASPSPSWRDLRGVAALHPHPLESVVLRTYLRTAFCLGNRQICSFPILCGFHVPRYLILLLLAALLWFLVAGKWIGLSSRMKLTWPSVTLRLAQPLAPTTC
ncbi:hypothetical protein TcCL_Unassigned02245 [Trypanosoma cruzi]|nr:hypothetical protein TcCL_Unassigned02245 [Trypanosoma cruzi]